LAGVTGLPIFSSKGQTSSLLHVKNLNKMMCCKCGLSLEIQK